MKLANLGKILGIAAFLIATAAVAADIGIKISHTSETLRYKMTVEVETPEGLKAGSAVREVRIIIPHPEIQGFNDLRTFPKGEAVAVDLGKRGVLFAVLDSDDYRYLFAAFPGSPPGFTPEGIKFFQETGKRGMLTVDNYPMLVWFKDINDPKSIQLVYETEDYETHERVNGFFHHKRIVADHFEEFFGKGVKLKSIAMETTDEEITIKIIKWLHWLPQYYDQRFDGDRSTAFNVDSSLANKMGSGFFSTELK